jgi:streptogramin lyase
VRALTTALLVLVLVVAVSASAKQPPPPTATAVVATGGGPCGIAARAGSLWIGVYGTGSLLRLDDRNGRREAAVDVGRWACRVAVGPAAIWVTRDRAGELVRVSLGSGRIRRTQVGTGTFDVLLAHGSVWTTSYDHGAIVRMRASTGRLERVYKDGPNPAGLASCAGRIWVGHGRDATWLTSIDPRTQRMQRVDVVLKAPGWPSCIRGQLWVTTTDSVLQIDPTRGTLVAHYRLGGTPAETAAGPDGLVWVTDKERSLIHRVDPVARRVVDSFAAGPGAYALARVGDAMWVTSFAGADVRRFER